MEIKHLTFAVSHSAVHKLKAKWGAPPTVAARSLATMYDATRVCVFCNQFFLEHIEQVALEDY